MNLGHSEMCCPGMERYELVEESAERRCLAEQSLNRSDHEEHGDVKGTAEQIDITQLTLTELERVVVELRDQVEVRSKVV